MVAKAEVKKMESNKTLTKNWSVKIWNVKVGISQQNRETMDKRCKCKNWNSPILTWKVINVKLEFSANKYITEKTKCWKANESQKTEPYSIGFYAQFRQNNPRITHARSNLGIWLNLKLVLCLENLANPNNGLNLVPNCF